MMTLTIKPNTEDWAQINMTSAPFSEPYLLLSKRWPTAKKTSNFINVIHRVPYQTTGFYSKRRKHIQLEGDGLCFIHSNSHNV